MNARVTPAQAGEIAEAFEHELKSMRKDWWCFLLLGLLLIACGAFAIAFPFVVSVSVTIVMGAAMMVAGVATVIGAFWAGKWSGFFLQLLIGVFYTVIGFAIIDAPIKTLDVFAVLIAAMFVVMGIFRIIIALSERFPQWGWALLSGTLTTLTGVIIFKIVKTLPEGGLWVVGILVAIELISNGWYWVMLGFTLKNLPQAD